MADINKGFGERLRALVKRSGATQKSLASEAGITPSALTFHLKGQVPSSTILLKYAAHFKVSVDYLLTGRDEASSGRPKPLCVPDTSPFYELIKDVMTMPKHRQAVLRDIFRVILESEKK